MPDFSLEAQLSGTICGIDEAGRGPWAGPVVAGAVILRPGRLDPGLASALDDSKKLGAKRREALFAALEAGVAEGAVVMATGEASVEEIDRLNILRATFLAMGRAVAALALRPDHALVDGNALPPLPCAATAVVRGDQRSLSIAAASIAAKVTRDALMAELDRVHPGYGFARHAGYGTEAHREALERLGPTPHHRRSFAPIHKILYGE
jgi:ribonuclease HII